MKKARRYLAWTAAAVVTGALAVAAAGCGGSSGKSASKSTTSNLP